MKGIANMENNTKQYDEHDLYTFASCGSQDDLNKKIDYLSQLAEEENWTVDDTYKNGILRYYVFYTFRQCHIQNRILYSSDKQWCCINTGLLDKHSNDIMMIFQINQKKSDKNSKEWFLKAFQTKADRDYMEHFDNVPSLAKYTDNIEDYYFDPDAKIVVNYEHILDDNWDRIYSVVHMDKQVMKALLVGVIESSKIRVQRNMRLVVPQLYNNKIMYLMPIYIPVNDTETVTMALAIEKTSTGLYRANTIFTKDDAYRKARLLMKPESNWLIDD